MSATDLRTIDLNSDMGDAEAVGDGTQESLMASLTSVNIACGGHAGDERTMRATIEQAIRHGLAIGAHAGYPDRAHFGREEMKLSTAAIADSVLWNRCGRWPKLPQDAVRVCHTSRRMARFTIRRRESGELRARSPMALRDGARTSCWWVSRRRDARCVSRRRLCDRCGSVCRSAV